MSASDNLSPVQFRTDSADRDYADKADAYDTMGADETESFGYSASDISDYQYERQGKRNTETSPKREVF